MNMPHQLSAGRPSFRHFAVLLACLAAGISAYSASRLAFCRAPCATDENCYVFQANSILDGRLFRPYPVVFGRMLNQKQVVFDPQRGMFSRYASGHALWLAPGVLLGDPFIMSALGAALVLLMLARCGTLLDAPRAAVIVFLLCSPHFMMTFGTLLSHTSGLVASSLMLLCYILWRRTGSVWYAVFAGLAWGWILHNRTLTALCLVIPFGVDALFQLRRRPGRKTFYGLFCFAAASAVCVALLLVYNYQLTGRLLGMTHAFYDPSEAMGFGPRHVRGSEINHDLANGLRNLGNNIAHLDVWLFGFRGSLVVAVALALIGWTPAWTPLLAGAWAATWLGYIFFWYPGPQETGPGYYLETLPFLCMAAALGTGRLWKLVARFPRSRAAAALLVVALMAATSARFMFMEGKELREFLENRGRMLACCRAAPPNSLIFFGQSAIADYMINNPRGVDSDPLMIRSSPGADITVMKYFPDRTPFFMGEEGLQFWIEPAETNVTLDAAIPALLTAAHTGSNFRDETLALRRAENGVHGKGWFAYGREIILFPGRFIAIYDMDVSGDPDEEVCVLDAATEAGTIILAKKTLVGGAVPGEMKLEIEVDDFTSVEPRVYYLGRGSITLRGIRIKEED